MNSTPTVTAVRLPRRSAWQVQRDVLFALVQREMKARVGGQWVGAVWTLIEPLAHVALMVAILGSLRGVVMPGIEYPVFLAVGLVPFFLFQNLAFRLMDGIDSNKGLFAYRQVKPFDTLISRALVESLMNLVVYGLTLGVMAWIGFHVLPNQPLQMLGVNLLIVLFGTAFGIFAAVITHDRPRARSLVRMLMLPLYFASGVIFPVNLLPREYIEILLWNPMLHLVDLSRASFIGAYQPTRGVNMLYPSLAMLVFGALGMLLYRARRRELIAS